MSEVKTGNREDVYIIPESTDPASLAAVDILHVLGKHQIRHSEVDGVLESVKGMIGEQIIEVRTIPFVR